MSTQNPSQPKTIKVAMRITIEVDPAAWTRDYGTEPSEIRNDVKTYVLGGIQESAAGQVGAIVGVTER